MIVLQPEAMARMDQETIEAGYPEILLMEAAGRGVAEKGKEILKEKQEVVVFCGKGNNGGDGLVAARYLDMWNYKVKIYLIGEKSDLEGVSLKNYNICQLRDIEIYEEPEIDLNLVENDIKNSNLVIDAMLGTGLTGNLRGKIAGIVDKINENKSRNVKVVAVDIPTGINGNNGKVLGNAVQADYTATMAFYKTGLCVYPGKKYAGKVEVIDIGMPKQTSIKKVGYNQFMLTAAEARDLLPAREETGHKGSFGKIGIVGGSRGMEGAPYLTGKGALKIGAGLVNLAVPEAIQQTVSGYTSEIITYGFSRPKSKVIENSTFVNKFLEKIDVLAVGPGMGRSQKVYNIIEFLLREFKGPLVLDADGINVVDKEILKKRNAPLILTPHPGEMSRLIESGIEEIQNNRIEIARNFARANNLYLVLKGAATIIAFPQGEIYINPTGNEGMATAGSGDVLTGIISGLLSQNLDYGKAVILGVYLHGLAGNIARDQLTSYCVNAEDIIGNISESIKYLKNN